MLGKVGVVKPAPTLYEFRGKYDMEHKYNSSHPARTLALAFCIAILVGNSLPELGNVMALWQGLHPHCFNIYFLVGGILGVIISSIALYRGLLRSDTIWRIND